MDKNSFCGRNCCTCWRAYWCDELTGLVDGCAGYGQEEHLLNSGHYMYCTASGHYMYRQWSLYVPPVVTICNASGHYMYLQWSLCTASGHYMYRQWSLNVPPVVTVCTASLTFSNSTFCPHTAFMCFLWISEQTAIISLYNINWPVCITETECVYCAVRTELLCFRTILVFSPSTAQAVIRQPFTAETRV